MGQDRHHTEVLRATVMTLLALLLYITATQEIKEAELVADKHEVILPPPESSPY